MDKELSKLLVRYRHLHGITQKDAAKRCKMCENAIVDFEKSRYPPKNNRIRSVVEGYDIPRGEFMDAYCLDLIRENEDRNKLNKLIILLCAYEGISTSTMSSIIGDVSPYVFRKDKLSQHLRRRLYTKFGIEMDVALELFNDEEYITQEDIMELARQAAKYYEKNILHNYWQEV